MVRKDFDKAYYDNYYVHPKTRVADEQDTLRLARFVFSYVAYLDFEIRSVLDLGCGVGRWQKAAEACVPEATYTGVEYSDYICETYGWEKGSVVDYSGTPADLVICHGVLQYLSGPEAKRAITNLSRLTQKVLYLELVTKEDWAENVDQTLTDGEIYLRSFKWYKKHLKPHFVSCGGGVLVPCDTPVALYEMEKAW